MRSRMRSRSASAKAAAIVRNSLDMPLPAMSPPRSSRWSLTPLPFRLSTTLSASRAERNRRSSLAAMTISPRSSLANSARPTGLSSTGSPFYLRCLVRGHWPIRSPWPSAFTAIRPTIANARCGTLPPRWRPSVTSPAQARDMRRLPSPACSRRDDKRLKHSAERLKHSASAT